MLQRVAAFALVFLLTFQAFNGYSMATEAMTTFESCQAIRPSELRLQLTQHVQAIFDQETDFKLNEKVERQWEELKVNDIFNGSVNIAVNKLRENTNLADKFASSWSGKKAGELASSILSKAMADKELKQSLSQLSENITAQIVSQISTATLASSEKSVACLRSFIGNQYASVFVERFNDSNLQEISKIPDRLDENAEFELSSDRLFWEAGYTGIGITGGIVRSTIKPIVKRVVGNIENRISNAIIGRIAGKSVAVVPFIGEAVGGVMLLHDLSSSFDGAFEAIQLQLQSLETQVILKAEVSKAFEDGIGKDLSEIPVGIANELYARWLDFQKDYIEILNITNEIPEVKQLINQSDFNLERMNQLVRVSLNSIGKFKLIAAIQDGGFGKALMLNPVIDQVIEQTESINTALEWSNLSGEQLPDIARLKLPKLLSLDGLTPLLLSNLLVLKNDATIQRLAELKPVIIERLLEISPENLIKLVQSVSRESLQRLAGYISELEGSETNELVKYLNGTPGLIRNEQVIAHIVKSHNIHRAILFIQTKTIDVEPLKFLRDIWLVLIGEVSWGLLNDKYGNFSVNIMITAIFGILIVALFLFYWLHGKILDMQQKKLSVEILKQQVEGIEVQKMTSVESHSSS